MVNKDLQSWPRMEADVFTAFKGLNCITLVDSAAW